MKEIQEIQIKGDISEMLRKYSYNPNGDDVEILSKTCKFLIPYPMAYELINELFCYIESIHGLEEDDIWGCC